MKIADQEFIGLYGQEVAEDMRVFRRREKLTYLWFGLAVLMISLYIWRITVCGPI